MRELSVITYPHLRILPITSANNPRNISPQFTRLNIRTSAAPHIRILPEAYFGVFISSSSSSDTCSHMGGNFRCVTVFPRFVPGCRFVVDCFVLQHICINSTPHSSFDVTRGRPPDFQRVAVSSRSGFGNLRTEKWRIGKMRTRSANRGCELLQEIKTVVI